MKPRKLDTQLFPAIYNDNDTELKKLFAAGANPSYAENGISLLAYAESCKSHNCLPIIRQQLRQFGNRDVTQQLIAVVEKNQPEKIVELVKAGADIKVIQLASELQHWDCVIEIAKQRKVTGYNKYYTHAFEAAAHAGQIKVMKCLITQGAYTRSMWTWSTVAHYAVKHRDLDLLNFYLTSLVKHYDFGQDDMFDCKDLEIPDAAGQTSIVYAAQEEQWEMVNAIARVYVKYLKEYSCLYQDAAGFGMTLVLAAQANQTETMKILLASTEINLRICDPSTGNFALHFMAQHNNADMAILLLKKGARANQKNNQQIDFIQYAFELKQIDFLNTVFKSKFEFNFSSWGIAKLCQYMLAGVNIPAADIREKRQEILEYICALPQIPEKDALITSALQPTSVLAKYLWSYEGVSGFVYDLFHRDLSGSEVKKRLELEAEKSQPTKDIQKPTSPIFYTKQGQYVQQTYLFSTTSLPPLKPVFIPIDQLKGTNGMMKPS